MAVALWCSIPLDNQYVILGKACPEMLGKPCHQPGLVTSAWPKPGSSGMPQGGWPFNE